MIYQDANIKVTAVENNHFDFHTGPAAGKHNSYAYHFEVPDRVIVFTGNTGPSGTVTALAQGADLLVTETSSCEDWSFNQFKRIKRTPSITVRFRLWGHKQPMAPGLES
jgi:hypothetical protein